MKPAAAVVVATARALKMHGGAARSELNRENLAALEAGLANLERHIQNVRKFHVDALVAVNHFDSDTPAEIEMIRRFVEQKCGAEAIVNESWRLGAAGAEALSRAVVGPRRSHRNSSSSRFIPTICR